MQVAVGPRLEHSYQGLRKGAFAKVIKGEEEQAVLVSQGLV